MRVSTKGQYALEALLYMARHSEQERWQARVIAETLAIKEKYLEQIFFALRKVGILNTVRGPKGGYFIATDLRELKISTILEAVEGVLIPVPCVACKEACGCDLQDICATRGLWYKIQQSVYQVIDHLSLYDLVVAYEKEEVGYCETYNEGALWP